MTIAPLALLDPQRTEQVIGNLVSNALRYAPEGGRVWVEIRRPASCCFSVNDNGPGVPEDVLQHLQPLLAQRQIPLARLGRGRPGLAIARQLMEAQGGNITAANLPEGGLQVRCEFPVI